MKSFFCFFALFLLPIFIGCDQSIDAPPAAIDFHEFPVQYPEWMENQRQGSNSEFSNCLELITVDFEPAPFGNLVQTIPYHIAKESIHDAFVSVKMQTQQIPWIIYFSSSEVQFPEQASVDFDEYSGNLDRYISTDQSICEVHLWDTLQAHNYLYTYEQLIAEIEIECYLD